MKENNSSESQRLAVLERGGKTHWRRVSDPPNEAKQEKL
jgi:hypothetical protein